MGYKDTKSLNSDKIELLKGRYTYMLSELRNIVFIIKCDENV